jgi:hypothetical protein
MIARTTRLEDPGLTGGLQPLSEEELLTIVGGGPILVGALVAATGAGIALVGVVVGVAVYWAVS